MIRTCNPGSDLEDAAPVLSSSLSFLSTREITELGSREAEFRSSGEQTLRNEGGKQAHFGGSIYVMVLLEVAS